MSLFVIVLGERLRKPCLEKFPIKTGIWGEGVLLRVLRWVGSSKQDLLDLPREVYRRLGQGLGIVQLGGMPGHAKVLQGFGGASVLELRERDKAGTYRAVYTVQFPGAVYVLHAFQKKSKQGIATPQQDLALIKARLKQAETHYARNGAPGAGEDEPR